MASSVKPSSSVSGRVAKNFVKSWSASSLSRSAALVSADNTISFDFTPAEMATFSAVAAPKRNV